MNIRCKFQCQSVRRFNGGEEIELTAISGKENEPWSKYTPAGRFVVTITNPAALGAFEPGKDYLLDVSPVPGAE